MYSGDAKGDGSDRDRAGRPLKKMNLVDADSRREAIREKLLKEGKKPNMRREKDLASALGLHPNANPNPNGKEGPSQAKPSKASIASTFCVLHSFVYRLCVCVDIYLSCTVSPSQSTQKPASPIFRYLLCTAVFCRSSVRVAVGLSGIHLSCTVSPSQSTQKPASPIF